ncbi:cytochrome P450 [Mitsuaria sp. GD03876]|uniref:cytochrome P450 n=1 Tax=Mitsuaria sp. GD03876 TaxID=2975399 RepID=UPI0024478F34|nr:cytochrome P450 [Mitsuaria sp. GD03876]MDH0865729.1 cytochrome P450 [Mitsuaria sp. GD03876]
MSHVLAIPDTVPGPRPRWAGLPEVLSMRRDYLGHFRRLQQRHGDVVHQRLLGLDDYNFFHPDHVRELLIASHDGMIRWQRATQVFADAHGQSVLVAEGPAWQRQRKLLQPGFSPQRVQGFVPLMVEASRQALDRAVPAGAGAAEVDFEGLMTLLTMDVILQTLFATSGVERGEASAEAAWAVHELGRVAMGEMYVPVSAPLWAPWKRGKRRALQALDGLIRGHVARRRAAEPAEAGGDLLALLMSLRDETGQGLDDTALRDECMTTFLAGHETTAAALTWWGWCMAAHPQAQRRAADEVDAVLGGRAPTAADLTRLSWLSLCIKETLRLYPPAPALFSRQASDTLSIAGLTLRRGALLRITPGVIQRDPRWFEDPDDFRPERFDPASGHAEIPRGAWMPFGAGPRVCLGSHFALTEITLVAAMVLQRFGLGAVPDAPPPEPVLQITLRPRHPLRLRLLPR